VCIYTHGTVELFLDKAKQSKAILVRLPGYSAPFFLNNPQRA